MFNTWGSTNENAHLKLQEIVAEVTGSGKAWVNRPFKTILFLLFVQVVVTVNQSVFIVFFSDYILGVIVF